MTQRFTYEKIGIVCEIINPIYSSNRRQILKRNAMSKHKFPDENIFSKML